MTIEIPHHEVSLKEEGIAQLLRVDSKKFGRGFSTGAKSSLPFEVNPRKGLMAMAEYAIEEERKSFPDNPHLEGRDFEVGVVVGVWIALKELEAAVDGDSGSVMRLGTMSETAVIL